ncbi:RNA helicase [Abortiporus biennis]
MEPISRSPALNPASTPFFPGSGLVKDEESRGSGLSFRLPIGREQYATASSLSISPSDYRSVKSSPSPSQDERDVRLENGNQFQFKNDSSRHSPAVNQTETERGFSTILRPPPVRETSMSSMLDTIPDSGEDTPGPTNGSLLPNNALYTTVMGRSREHINTPPVALENGSKGSSYGNAPLLSTSPASSLDSGSLFTSSADLSVSFETQLKTSPLINDVLDRLMRFEFTTREIQRDLSDVHRKVDLLLERSLNSNSPPEFRDPFASSTGNPSFSAPGMLSARNSVIGNIAPNQPGPSDDISSLSHRLNSLTRPQTGDMSTNNRGLMGPPTGIGMGLPSRPDLRPTPRMPNPPMRTWSAGTLDLTTRASESGPNSALIRQDAIFRDKRRSVSSLLRRESVGGESIAGSQSSSRDGPIITKWEQLALASELLRSLSTFGIGPPNKIQQRALPFLLRGADIIAQAPPTQERIAAYVIPAIHIALTSSPGRPLRGPLVVMISTTVDQATQAQRMIRDLGGPIGVRSALGVGSASVNSDLSQELRLLQQNMPHIICGTPQKLNALFTSQGGLSGGEVRFLVLDEVDQLIARNLHEFVFNIVKLLPPARSRPLGSLTPTASASQSSFTTFDNGSSTSLSPPFQQNVPRRISISPAPPAENANGASGQIERQTALFSNTVPQDVLNLATAIHLREPVRVLVRRDGNVTHADTSQGARGLRQFYLYLAFTASGRSDAPLPTGGLGIIGSGRGATSAETAQAREWKLDALADLFDDLEVPQAIIHVGGMTALDAVVYKLASRGHDAVPLHPDMNAAARLTALTKFRSPPSASIRPTAMKILVVYDVPVKSPEVSQVPLIVNYDLPKAVEEYAHRVAPAIAPSYSRAGVVVNFVTATGGDVEMLRSIECFYKIKCPEVPMSLRDIV